MYTELHICKAGIHLIIDYNSLEIQNLYEYEKHFLVDVVR